MRRNSLNQDTCAIARSLDIVGDWWTLLIIRDAVSGVKRFNDFHRSLGVAKNMLASRLKLLVSHGLLDVSTASSGASYHEYTLTDKGRALLPVLTGLAQWGNEFLFEDEEPRSLPLDAKSGRPLAPMQMRSQDGRDLDVLDVVVPRPEAF